MPPLKQTQISVWVAMQNKTHFLPLLSFKTHPSFTPSLSKGILVTTKLKKALEVGARLLRVSRQPVSAQSKGGSGKLSSIFSTILISSSVSKVSKNIQK